MCRCTRLRGRACRWGMREWVYAQTGQSQSPLTAGSGGWSLSLAAMGDGCVIIAGVVLISSSMLGMVVRGRASCIAAVDGAGVDIIHCTEDKNAISGICTAGGVLTCHGQRVDTQIHPDQCLYIQVGRLFSSKEPFGGLNVKFPPVASGTSSLRCNPAEDLTLVILGRKFVIELMTQVRTTDCVWVDFL